MNITPLLSGQDAVLNIYRVGYHPDDKKDIPYKSFAIPQEMVNEHNKYDWHTVTLRSNLGFTQFYVDNTDKQIGSVNLNPLGQGGDFIAFPVVGDVGYFVGYRTLSLLLLLNPIRLPCSERSLLLRRRR